MRLTRAIGVAIAAGIIQGALGCSFGAPPVTRVVDGHQVVGRFVPDTAYAAFLDGVLLENEGDLAGAAGAYRRALSEDGDRPEIWTRIGAVLCDGSQVENGDAWSAFERAIKIDPTFEEAWAERGRCALVHGDGAHAEEWLRTAVQLDPDRAGNVELLATALVQSGHKEEARRWLDALELRHPDARDVKGVAAGRPRAIDGVDRALRAGDLVKARRLALGARVSSGALVLRAAALGLSDLARDQAMLVLAADPANPDALAGLLVAADLARDPHALDDALEQVITAPNALSPLGVLLVGELLERRVGPDAAAAWRDAAGSIDDAGDSLFEQVKSRRF